MRVTIRKIADELSLSTATVSRALNQREDAFISDATRQRVLNVAKELGYWPNNAARALVTGRTQTIGLWLNNMVYGHEPFYLDIICQVQRHATQHQYELLMRSFTPEQQTESSLGLAHLSVDGILAVDCPKPVLALLQGNAPSHVPIVSMGTYHVKQTDYVGVDLAVGAREAVEHLLTIGCNRLAYLGPAHEEELDDGTAREMVYRDCLTAAGRLPEYIRATDNTPAHTRECLSAYIATHGCPDGIFCFNDNMAIGAYRAIRDKGLRIPQDVALIGCDGIEIMEYFDPPLSTVVQPTQEMCSLAWQFLQNRLLNSHLPLQQAMLKPRLLKRASSER